MIYVIMHFTKFGVHMAYANTLKTYIKDFGSSAAALALVEGEPALGLEEELALPLVCCEVAWIWNDAPDPFSP